MNYELLTPPHNPFSYITWNNDYRVTLFDKHLPYKANHSRGKTFAVDQATAKVFPQTKYSPVIGVHTS